MNMNFTNNIPATINGLELLQNFKALADAVSGKGFDRAAAELADKLKEVQGALDEVNAVKAQNVAAVKAIRDETEKQNLAAQEARKARDDAEGFIALADKKKAELESDKAAFVREKESFEVLKTSLEKEMRKDCAKAEEDRKAAKELRDRAEAMKDEWEAKIKAFQKIAKTPQAHEDQAAE
jgi:chromosome segregation ATPase